MCRWYAAKGGTIERSAAVRWGSGAAGAGPDIDVRLDLSAQRKHARPRQRARPIAAYEGAVLTFSLKKGRATWRRFKFYRPEPLPQGRRFPDGAAIAVYPTEDAPPQGPGRPPPRPYFSSVRPYARGRATTPKAGRQGAAGRDRQGFTVYHRGEPDETGRHPVGAGAGGDSGESSGVHRQGGWRARRRKTEPKAHSKKLRACPRSEG